MIKITTFNPFRNFLRIIHEFHEDKVLVKIKSLSIERNVEFSYKEVGEITDGFYTSYDQRFFSFWLTCITNILLSIFCRWFTDHPLLFLVTKIFFISGVFLYLTSYIKKRQVFIVDKNKITLTYLQQNILLSNNPMEEALEKLTNESVNADEISTVAPFPENSPTFKHNYFKFSNFVKTEDFFYEDEIIGLEKSIFGQKAYKVKYSSLSGNTYSEKKSDGLQWLIFEWGFLTLAIISGLDYGFGVQSGINPLYFLLTIGIIFSAAWIAALKKRDVFGFYNKNGQIEYWAYVSRSDKEKFEKIIEFVKSKIPEGLSEHKEEK